MIRAYDNKEKLILADLVEEQARKKIYAVITMMTMLICMVLIFLFFRIRSYNQKLNVINKKVAQQNKLLAEAIRQCAKDVPNYDRPFVAILCPEES